MNIQTQAPAQSKSPAPAERTIYLGDPRVEKVFVDVETTGLGKKDRVVEIAAVIVRGAEVVDVWTTLVDAGVPIPDKASEVNRITDADLVGAPTFAEIAPALLARMRGRIVVAHNVSFDWRMLANEFHLAGIDIPPVSTLCTKMFAREILDLPSVRLGDCCEHLGIDLDGWHAAMADTMACAQLGIRLTELAQARGLGHTDYDVARPVNVGGELPSWVPSTYKEWYDQVLPVEQFPVVPVKPRA